MKNFMLTRLLSFESPGLQTSGFHHISARCGCVTGMMFTRLFVLACVVTVSFGQVPLLGACPEVTTKPDFVVDKVSFKQHLCIHLVASNDFLNDLP